MLPLIYPGKDGTDWKGKAEVFNDQQVSSAWLKAFWHFYLERCKDKHHDEETDKIITSPWPLLLTSDKRLISPGFNRKGPPSGNNYTPILSNEGAGEDQHELLELGKKLDLPFLELGVLPATIKLIIDGISEPFTLVPCPGLFQGRPWYIHKTTLTSDGICLRWSGEILK